MLKEIFKRNAGNKELVKKESSDEHSRYVYVALNHGEGMPMIFPIPIKSKERVH